MNFLNRSRQNLVLSNSLNQVKQVSASSFMDKIISEGYDSPENMRKFLMGATVVTVFVSMQGIFYIAKLGDRLVRSEFLEKLGRCLTVVFKWLLVVRGYYVGLSNFLSLLHYCYLRDSYLMSILPVDDSL